MFNCSCSEGIGCGKYDLLAFILKAQGKLSACRGLPCSVDSDHDQYVELAFLKAVFRLFAKYLNDRILNGRKDCFGTVITGLFDILLNVIDDLAGCGNAAIGTNKDLLELIEHVLVKMAGAGRYGRKCAREELSGLIKT